jgi:hypothetical protein
VALAGLLGYSLLQALRRAGVVKNQPTATMGRLAYPLFLAAMVALAVGVGWYLSNALKGPPTVTISGDVEAPYTYSAGDKSFQSRQAQLELNGMKRQYTGVPPREIVARARPKPEVGVALVTATDGYSFFITMAEVQNNDDLLLAHRGEKEKLSYEIAGAENQKAWVRNVRDIRLVALALVEVRGAVKRPFPYNPDDWQFEMDNGNFDFGGGKNKYQGASLQAVVVKWEPRPETSELVFWRKNGEGATLPLADVLNDKGWRIWTVNSASGMSFAIAHDDGRVLASEVVTIEVR